MVKDSKKNQEKVRVLGFAVEIRTSDNTDQKRHESNQTSRSSDGRTESTVSHFSIKFDVEYSDLSKLSLRVYCVNHVEVSKYSTICFEMKVFSLSCPSL